MNNFETMLEECVSELPPEEIVDAVNPWKQAMNRILWGMAFTTITFQFWNLDYILPMIGMFLMLFGFRTLREENKWFKTCWQLMLVRITYFVFMCIFNATIYRSMHLFGYGLSMDELKNFRQWGSKTPGHPEFGHTAGVDITTGPLGSGMASAVGMAMAAKYLAAQSGLDAAGLLDSKIYIICGDGCMMEGATSEAASLAGHQKLDNIICFYDDNNITIEGNTSLAFTEDVGKRFEAYNWRVLYCDNANDVVLRQCQRCCQMRCCFGRSSEERWSSDSDYR